MVSVYASAGLGYWIYGGVAGMVTALLLLCAGLLHVSVTTHAARSVMFASVTPYMVILCSLALIYGPISGAYGWGEAIAVAAAMIGFFSNFKKGADLLQATISKLRAALSNADHQRAAAETRHREAELAHDAKSRFLANMSHELRLPSMRSSASMNSFPRAPSKTAAPATSKTISTSTPPLNACCG